MDNPAVIIPYIIMAINVVTLAGMFAYAAYCVVGRSCEVSVPDGLNSVK